MFLRRLIVLINYCTCYYSSLPITGPNVCSKIEGGITKTYCCFNHYVENGQCKACSPGTTTSDAISCHPCVEKSYGEACKFTCDCKSYEKCHPVLGCIDATPTTTTPEPHVFASISTHIDGDTYTIQWPNRSNYSTSAASIESTNPSSRSENTVTVVYYLVITGGIVGWCVFCFAVILFIYRRSKHKSQMAAEHSNVRIQENGSIRSSQMPTENIYHEIEDIPTPEVTMKRNNSYLSVVGSEMSHESIDGEKNINCVVHNAENGRLERTNSSLSSSSEGSQCSDKLPNFDGYLHPYNLLISDNANENTYNKCKNTQNSLND